MEVLDACLPWVLPSNEALGALPMCRDNDPRCAHVLLALMLIKPALLS
jgi:hypothetical protein